MTHVNYYERYCGDYGRDTAHLSLAEHGVYTLLLDVQYATERGLPTTYADLGRICRAMNKAELASVRRVADQFFPPGEDGLRWNPRAQREIAAARKRIEASRANGRNGGRPHKPNGNPSGFYQVPDGMPAGTQQQPNGNPSETCPGEASPYPIPQKVKVKVKPSCPVAPDGFVRFWQAWPPSERKVSKAKCREVWKRRKLDDHADRIVAHVTALRDSKQWRDGYDPAPLTYLNQSRWEDDFPDIEEARKWA